MEILTHEIKNVVPEIHDFDVPNDSILIAAFVVVRIPGYLKEGFQKLMGHLETPMHF